jgi:cytidylate kinase
MVVMAGRDIGTVILPEADLKIYLVASVEERARRRHKECVERGENVTYESVLEGMRMRDEIDSTREVAPLQPAEDAVTLDSDDKDIATVFEAAMSLVKGARETDSN